MDVPDDLTPAERRLLEALRAGEPCDLLDNSRDPTNDEIAKWDDPTRIVRAKVLRAVLLDQYPQIRPDYVELRGAIIAGDLKLTDDLRPSVRLQSCRIGNARFYGATFTGDARFERATFTGLARFERATFTGDAWFDGATFTGLAWFDGATFTGDAWFDGATFTATPGSAGSSPDNARSAGPTSTEETWVSWPAKKCSSTRPSSMPGCG